MKARKVEIMINGKKVQSFEVSKGNEITNIKVFADDQLLFNTYSEQEDNQELEYINDIYDVEEIRRKLM